MGPFGWQARWIVRAICIVVALFLGLMQAARAPPASAAPVEEIARGHYTLASALYDAGRFEDAAREFAAAYEIAPRTALLYNLYLAHRDGGHMPEAADALSRYVATLEEGPTKVQLRARLAALERMLATPDPTSQGEGAGESSRAGENTSFVDTVDPGQLPDDGTAPARSDHPASPPATSASITATRGETEMSSPSLAPWIVVGTGAGLVLTSAVVGGFALKAQSDLESICPNREACPAGSWQSTRDRGHRLAVSADVLWASGAAIGVAGLLWVLLRRPVEREAVSAWCTSRSCALAVRGSF